MPITPYVVGQWVRGDRFYGRQELLDQILEGNRNCVWLLGTRRVGKTSVLKQLEHLALAADSPEYLPIFWDFQGSEEPDDLDEGFSESLLDISERLEDLGIDPDSVEGTDLFDSLGRLRRELRSRNLKLLLLCDEVEELISVNRNAPRFLRRLRRALQSAENIRTVLSSNVKLWDLAEEETTTSPFLHGFTPPMYVSGLSDDDARALIAQSQLPEASRPDLDGTTIDTIRERCNNHPYLLQVLCERHATVGNLNQATGEISVDKMVTHFFSVDFGMLSDDERRIVRNVAGTKDTDSQDLRSQLEIDDSTAAGGLLRLEQLGFLRRVSKGRYAIASYFLRNWCRNMPDLGSAAESRPDQTIRVDGSSGLGSIDNRYQLLELLGTGAAGEVWKARDGLLDTEIAIKLLKSGLGGGGDSFERLKREVVLSRGLVHPNIVRVYHLGADGGRLYVTMECIDGRSLAQVVANGGAMPESRVLAIGRSLAGALMAAHGQSVLHRDIKSSNILIDGDDQPKVTDFGLARLLGAPGITTEGVFLGTPAYASPEQIRSEAVDHRSDIYSLGVVLYEMALGERPFIAESISALLFKHLDQDTPVPRDDRPELSKALSDAIVRCMAKEPDDRFQSAADLLEVLDGIGS